MNECDEIVDMSYELDVDKENTNKRSYIGFSQGEMGKKDSVDDSSYGDSLNCQIENNTLPLEPRNVFDMSPIYWKVHKDMNTNKVTESFVVKDGIQRVEDRTYLEEKDNVLFIIAESNSIEEAYSLIEIKSKSLALILKDECYEEQEWS